MTEMWLVGIFSMKLLNCVFGSYCISEFNEYNVQCKNTLQNHPGCSDVATHVCLDGCIAGKKH